MYGALRNKLCVLYDSQFENIISGIMVQSNGLKTRNIMNSHLWLYSSVMVLAAIIAKYVNDKPCVTNAGFTRPVIPCALSNQVVWTFNNDNAPISLICISQCI